MKIKPWMIVLLNLVIILSPLAVLAEKAGDIDYDRTKFQFGQAVYFNLGDNFCDGEPYDGNEYVFPHIYNSPDIKKGIFINIEDYGFPPGGASSHLIATIACVDRYGKGMTITRHVIRAIPQQKTIIFNW